MENPLEFGIVITDDDGSIERFLEKPTWGQVFSDTINTGIYVLEPEIFDYIEAGRSVDFSEEVFPALLDDGKPLLRLSVRGLLGGRRHARGLRQCPPGRARRQGRARHPRLPRSARASGWARAQRSTRRPASTGRSSSATTAGSRPAPTWPSTPCSAPTCASAPTRYLAARGRARQRLPRRLGAAAGQRDRTLLRPAARAPAAKRVWCSATSASSASTPSSTRASRSTRSRPSSPGAIINSSIVWESRGARRLFGRHGIAGLANVDITPELAVARRHGLRNDAEEGRDRHHVARHEPGGPSPQACGDGRAQRRRRRRRRPRGRDRAGHPVP